MLTRRQKNSLRGFTAALSCSALLAAFLFFTNISNASDAEPVVFSDILEGAVAYNDGSDIPDGAATEAEMTETMFAEELATFTLRLSPEYTYPAPVTAERPTPENTPIDIDGVYGETTSRPDDTTGASPEQTTPGDGGVPLLSNEILQHSPDDTSVTTSAPVYATYSQEYQGVVGGTGTQTSAAATTQATTTTAASTTTTQTTTTTTAASTTTTQTTTTTTAAETTTTQTTAATTAATTTTQTTAATTAAATTTQTTTATVTAPADTTAHTEKTAFTNIGGGTFSEDSEIYLTMFTLVNQARRSAGLSELWYSARVHEVCEMRTQELTSYYSHTRPDGRKFSTAFKDVGVSYKLCGENIAYGRNMFSTPEEVFKAWMDSPSHRENILNPDFECVAFGLSILKVGNDTYYYWSQEFAALS